ncbi:MAG: hypothetical protein JRK53_11810 [Deltaproteobacteria bacterium]|nr:hypothetical protein [Deltaproteobacteria bacterium]MBW2283329.1 hypothetical protein [Deltaproteobacteria bacterium]
MQVIALCILAVTVGLSLTRPKLARFRIDHASAAILGALLCILTGAIPLKAAYDAFHFLLQPVLTIVSLMTITLIADQSGLFHYLARKIAAVARGDGRKLFFFIFLTGSLTGTIFTNDAAVLMFTPLVFELIEDIHDGWDLRAKIPFYFAVLYVANVAGALIISNPINIVASSFFDIAFLDYAAWMIVPAVVSIAASYVGIRIVFRNDIPRTFNPPVQQEVPPERRRAMVICAIVLFLTLVAFFSETLTGISTWLVAAASALVLLALHGFINGGTYGQVVRGIGWDVIIFVTGIFIVANAISRSGLTDHIGALLAAVSGDGLVGLTHATGFAAAGFSAIMNNHPTAYIMPMVIQDMGLSDLASKMLLFSALIGGDVGPKMLPIGSLAALMWFRILRQKGVDIPYGLYIRIGIPVSLAAIFFGIITLNLEMLLSGLFAG